ncbi:MAG: hypothetical protein HC785_11795 [Calothrix sp. CSU_2_0]|nr:hypothetical protein [Calothrix sp. CSU_2_0]
MSYLVRSHYQSKSGFSRWFKIPDFCARILNLATSIVRNRVRVSDSLRSHKTRNLKL